MMKVTIALALAASASAFAPQLNARVPTKLMFENDAKKDIYAKWDPSKPRSGMNFNPFETYKGNSPDASGVYPGEPRYKDPTRGDVSFAIMMEEKAESEEREKNPKAGSEPGCPGCKN